MQSFYFKNISCSLLKRFNSFTIKNNKCLVNSNFIKTNKKFNSNNYKFQEETKAQETIDDLIGQNNPNVNSNQSSYMSNNSNQNINKKRTRLSFLRDGMIISFYLRKNINTNESGSKNEGYVYVELKEYTENFTYDRNNANRDPRFIMLKGIALAKFLLITPKASIDSNSKQEKISKLKYNYKDLYQKFRNLDVQQSSENKYVFTLKVLPKNDLLNGQNNTNDSPLVSQIELNPEDMIILQKFVNKCIDELLNF